MKLLSILQSAPARVRQKPLLAAALALVVILTLMLLVKAARPARQELSFFEVKRGDFLISIVEGGTVEAVHEEVVRSEVEGTARVIFIVPEGSTVSEGDLLVELDSSASQDAVNVQQINVEKAEFAFVQAEQQLEIQKSVVDSEVDAAELKFEFAQSDLNKYLKGEQLQLRRNAEIEITNVMETLKINEERLEWTKQLHEQGYETKSNLDKDQLAVSQSRLKLEQAQKALWMLTIFDEPKKKRELEALLQEAKDNLARVKLQGERKIEQFKADVSTQKSTLDLSKLKLERDKKQLAATKIYAPQDGLVVYAGGGDRRFSSESFIEEGAVVRNRQELIKLPDISAMKLNIRIHESHINHVRVGQPAYVVLDAMPDRRFQGIVNRVAPLPDSQSRWGNPNLKVYATEVFLTESLPNVKPGVSARAEVVITNLQHVLTAPIQAVTTRRGKQVVFLAGSLTPIPVSVGLYNTKFIEITSGLKEGDRVLLSPPFDTEEKDLGDAIIADGDKLPTVQLTNGFAGDSRGREAGERLRPRRERGAESAGMDAIRPGGRQDFGGSTREGPGTDPRGGPDNAAGPRGPRFDRTAMLAQFDKNRDGELDESERAAMREQFGRGRRGGGTNAPPGGNLP